MDIKIGKSAHTCAVCESDFVHEQGIHSLIRVVEGQFTREDYCDSCRGDEQAQGAYSTWNAQYYDPHVAEQEPEESFSPLRQTFYAAAEETTRPSLSIAYLAGQLLRRQKVFRLIKETKDPDTDASVWLFNDRIGNRLIEVSDPSLSHAELETARQTLMERLMQLEAPEEESDEAEGETDTEVVSTDAVEVETEEETEAETLESTESTSDASTQETAQV